MLNNLFECIFFLGKVSYKILKDVEIEVVIFFVNFILRQGGEINFGEKFIDGIFSCMYDICYWRICYKGVYGGLVDNVYNDEYGNVLGKEVWWSVYENEYI